MKKLLKLILGLGLVVGLYSCTNELPGNYDKVPTDTVQLVKSPEVSVWTGYNYAISLRSLYSTRSADANFEKWQSDRNWQNVPNDPVSEDEKNFVINYIAEHPDEGYDVCNLTDYYIQNVGSSKDEYVLEFIDSNGSVHHTSNVVGGNQMDYLVIDGYHINDYNATTGSLGLCTNMQLVNITYHDSYANLTISAFKFYYIAYQGKTNVYLCLDYRTAKYDNGNCEYNGDGVYNDWVIKLTPADGSAIVPPTSEPNNPNNPGNILPEATSEVEVNLAINDQHKYQDISDLVTKLSVHVRYPGDVKITIPGLERVVLDSDDLYIFNNHENILVHSGQLADTQVGSYNVTWTWEVTDGEFAIETKGMNQDIFDYCVENFGDGLNFEAYLYCNKTLQDAGTLKGILDNATIEFVSNEYPDYYINAFTGTHVLNTDLERDCFVNIIDSQRGWYAGPKTGKHLNGTPYNLIYKYGGNPDDDSYEHGHTFLWGMPK